MFSKILIACCVCYLQNDQKEQNNAGALTQTSKDVPVQLSVNIPGVIPSYKHKPCLRLSYFVNIHDVV